MAKWQVLLLMLMPLAIQPIECKVRKTHLHLHSLTNHTYQHNPETQKDYVPVLPPIYPKDDNPKLWLRGKDPLLLMCNRSLTTLKEHLVRIYAKGVYICMGTLQTNATVFTAATCFENAEERDLTIKTWDNQTIPLLPRDPAEMDSMLNNDLIYMFKTQKPVATAQECAAYCEDILRPKFKVVLPTYIRRLGKIHTQITEVLPLAECRERLNDPTGKVVTATTICVRNTKYTTGCQKTYGSPLLHEGFICGVNILGHNCPNEYGVDLYALLADSNEMLSKKVGSVIMSQVENYIF